MAGYLDKEMAKTFGDNRKRLQGLGFIKRYSNARDWPKMPPLVLDKESWRVVAYRSGKYMTKLDNEAVEETWKHARPEGLKAIGDELALEIMENSFRKARLGKVKRWHSVSD